MSSLASAYPSALNIAELQDIVDPLIEDDYYNVECGKYKSECLASQYFLSFDKFYILELDHSHNQLIVVECKLDWF